MADNKTADIKMSTASKTRKSLSKLQKMKDEGEKICQVCPAELGPFFALAAEMVGCDVFRVPGILSVRAGALQNTNWDAEWTNSQLSVIKYREYSKIMHLNFYLPIQFYADKVDAVKYGAQLIFDGADSILPMGCQWSSPPVQDETAVPVALYTARDTRRGALPAKGGSPPQGEAPEAARKAFTL